MKLAVPLIVTCTNAVDAWFPSISHSRSTITSKSLEVSKICDATKGLSEENGGFENLVEPNSASAEKHTGMTVVGCGRVGSMLANGVECTCVGPDDSIDPNGEGPIFVATRNDSLDDVVEKCPKHRRKDLVFMQNGYLDEFLQRNGLIGNTQVLLHLSVRAIGADPIDGATKSHPDGLTAATGRHASTFANCLAALGLKCRVLTADEFRPAMFEKLIWISTYMLVGATKGCSSVGQAERDSKDLLGALIHELVEAVSFREQISFSEGVTERLASITETVADCPCAVKEFEWRNRYFYNLGDDSCPIHNSLLRECSAKDVLDFELP